MTVRGQLAFNDVGELIAIDPNAVDPTDPSQTDIIPLPISNADIGTLNGATLANGTGGQILELDGNGQFNIVDPASGGGADIATIQATTRRRING